MNQEQLNNQEQIFRPVVLVILDGFGIAPSWGGNAITQSRMKNYFESLKHMPHTQISASGESVGLPDSEEGNSEVGHINIGTGTVLEQHLKKINRIIDSNQFFHNKNILNGFNYAKQKNKTVHLMGVFSHGGVHGDINHLYALLKMASIENVKDVKIHLFTDGRDSPPFEAHHYLKELEKHISQEGIGQISTIIGRYYAMDRDRRWDRTQKAYELLTQEIGRIASSAGSAISNAYKNGLSDEFITPTVIKHTHTHSMVKDGDVVIFYNFRKDRARQLTDAFLDPKFSGFQRSKILHDLYFISFIDYEEKSLAKSVFENQTINWPLARVISSAGKTQLHIAETEKYAHITYFFNGGNEKPFKNEDWVLIPSPKVSTYDIKPEMSAGEITATLLKRIQEDRYNFIVVNYANPDMVGHSGNIDAVVKCLNYLDQMIGEIKKLIIEKNGLMIITSDHGNCEEMLNPTTGEKSTDHNDNKVPFILIGSEKIRSIKLRQEGKLADIAPTILELMKIQKPTEMTGQSLIEKVLK